MNVDLLRHGSASAGGGSCIVLEGVQLIDGSGSAPVADAVVVVAGDTIAYAGPRSAHSDSLTADRYRLSGKTVIPGLIEVHTHASFDADMLAYVRNGITTLRFAGLNQNDVGRLKQRIDAGELVGPRILSCGPMIDIAPAAYPEWTVTVADPAEAEAVAERLIGVDGVDALILTQRVTAAVMRAVTTAAHAHGRPVIAQTWLLDGAEAAGLGIDELHNSSRVFHSAAYPRERLLAYGSIADRLALSGRGWATIDWDATEAIIEAMVERGVAYCGMQVITQFQLGEGTAELNADPDFCSLFGETERSSFFEFLRKLQGTWSDEDFAHWKVANENRLEWMRRFRALGGALIFGTDMQFGGIMLHRELANALRLGMTPLEIIASATGVAASVLRVSDRLGSLRKGLKADLVVLNRSPSHDLSALRDIVFVMKGGRVVWGDGSGFVHAPS
jgi:imidazolonepropionase-like amidohydrolase